jgi:hypothetical protein
MSFVRNRKSNCVHGLLVLLLFNLCVIPDALADPADTTAPAEPATPAEAPPTAEDTSNLLQLDYIPADAMFVLAFRPAELFGVAQRKVVQSLVEVRGAEYEELTFVQRKAAPQDRSYLAFDAQVVRSKEPVNWREVLPKQNGVKFTDREFEGKSYMLNSQLRNVAGYQSDDRTLLIAPPWNLELMMARGKGQLSDFPWADAWRQASHRPLAIFMDADFGRVQLKSLVEANFGADFSETSTPLWKDLRWITVSVSGSTPMEIEIAATYANDISARRAYAIAAGLMSLARTEIGQIRARAGESASGGTADRLKMGVLSEEFVQNAQVDRSGAEIRLRTTSNFEIESFLTEFHKFSTGSRRKAALARE